MHKDILSSQERHQNMKWFDAGTQKMSVPSFSNFIKLIKVQCTGSEGHGSRRGTELESTMSLG